MALFERLYLLFVPVRDKTIQPYLKHQSRPDTDNPKDPILEGASTKADNKSSDTARSNRASKFGYPKDPA